jgi:hypothetical protein
MSRRFTDPVEVRTRVEASGPVPDQFLWHGRLYVVREVLARWTESGSWWRSAAVTAVRTGEALSVSTTGSTTATALRVDDRSTQWWRVEADSGRLAALSAGPGVYDLCFTESTATWSLKRVMD